MATLTQIDIGTNPNDGTGDELRTAFSKINDNYTKTEEVMQLESGITIKQEGAVPTIRKSKPGANPLVIASNANIDITALNDTTITNNLIVNGATTLTGDMAITGATSINGLLTLESGLLINSPGPVTITSDMTINGDIALDGNLVITNGVITGNSTLDGAVTVTGLLTAEDDVVVAGTITAADPTVQGEVVTLGYYVNNPPGHYKLTAPAPVAAFILPLGTMSATLSCTGGAATSDITIELPPMKDSAGFIHESAPNEIAITIDTKDPASTPNITFASSSLGGVDSGIDTAVRVGGVVSPGDPGDLIICQSLPYMDTGGSGVGVWVCRTVLSGPIT